MTIACNGETHFILCVSYYGVFVMKKLSLLITTLIASGIITPAGSRPAGGSPGKESSNFYNSLNNPSQAPIKRQREYCSTWQTAMNFLEKKYGSEINHIIDIESNLKALYPLADIHSSEIAPFDTPKRLVCEVATYTIISRTSFRESCNKLSPGLEKKLITLFENNLRTEAILEKPYSSLEIKCALYSSLRRCFSEKCISSWSDQIENLIRNKSFRGFISPTYISSHSQAVDFLCAVTAIILDL